ncbi:MAG: glycosyltransferase family 4 protein [Bacteroidia bacterium]
MKKIAYIISSVNKSVAFEWIAEDIDSSKFELFFILLNNQNSPLENFLIKKDIPTFRVNYKNKNDIPLAIFKIMRILKQKKIDIVHCHLFDACIVGLTAAKILGIKKRIHTRHNATIHHQYHPQAVKYDKYINSISTDIIAISENVKNILVEMEHVNPSKIILIHHGFQLEEFENISQERIENVIARNFSLKPKSPVIGVISRYIHWKGIQYIIPAFKKIIEIYPNAHLVLANAGGPYKNEIETLLSELPKNNYTEINFEEDIFALYQLFDIFVHAPIDEKSEAFGQVYIETMAAGVPSVVSLSGIAADYIKHNENALVVPFKNSEQIATNIIQLIENLPLKEKIIEEGKKSIKKIFSMDVMITKLEKLYGE